MSLLRKSGATKVLNKRYASLILSQSSTDAPTVVTNVNNFGPSLTWARSGAGEYAASGVGPWCSDKTKMEVRVGAPYAVNRSIVYDYTNSTPQNTVSVLKFSCRDLATPSAADLGTSVPIEIIVWD